MLIKINKSVKNNGFTLLEVLFTLILFAVAMLGILNVFVYKGKMDSSVHDMNIAVMLAEQKIEEYFKFPYNEMPPGATDYIVYRLSRDPISVVDKAEADKTDGAFERVVIVSEGINTTTINVRVNYGGFNPGTGKYRFTVELETQKGK